MTDDFSIRTNMSVHSDLATVRFLLERVGHLEPLEAHGRVEAKLETLLQAAERVTERTSGRQIYWCWWAGYGAMGGRYVKRVLIGRVK